MQGLDSKRGPENLSQTNNLSVGDDCVITQALTCQTYPLVCAGQLPVGPLSIQGQDSWEMGSLGIEAGLFISTGGWRRGTAVAQVVGMKRETKRGY